MSEALENRAAVAEDLAAWMRALDPDDYLTVLDVSVVYGLHSELARVALADVAEAGVCRSDDCGRWYATTQAQRAKED